MGSMSTANAQVLTRAYDSRGNLTDIYVPEIRTTITYGSAPGFGGTGPYPTQVVYAPGTAEARTWTYDWDYESGALNSKTDADNGVTASFTFDALGRPTVVNEGNIRKTVTMYDDDDLLVKTVSDLHGFRDGLLQSITRHDERGRPVRTRVSDGTPLGIGPTATDGINVRTRYRVVPGVGLFRG
jgi:YD repeat-containing protein